MRKCVDGCTCGKHKTLGYPRTCRRGHHIETAEGDYHSGRNRVCKKCISIFGADKYVSNRDAIRARTAAYQQTPKGRDVQRRANDKYFASTKGYLCRVRSQLSAAYSNREGLL